VSGLICGLKLVHGQVTIIFVVSVCLLVCADFFSAVFDPISIATRCCQVIQSVHVCFQCPQRALLPPHGAASVIPDGKVKQRDCDYMDQNQKAHTYKTFSQ